MFSGKGDFWLIFSNTLKYTAVGVVVSVGWALLTALLLNRKVLGSGLAASFFAPAVVPYIAMAFALQLLLRADLGVINYWDALDEAARIDGASEWQIFMKIIVPLARPVFITIGLLSSIFWWNEFFVPLVFLQAEKLKPLSVGIFSFARTWFLMRWDLVMAIATLMIVPPLLLFIVGRRYITEGITTTGLK